MRTRAIKPGFFKNAEVSDLPFEGRLLFIGMWCMADRNGIIRNRPRQFKGELFPFDNINDNTIQAMVCLLSDLGLIIVYKFPESAEFIKVINFSKHQCISNGEKKNRKLNGPEPGEGALVLQNGGGWSDYRQTQNPLSTEYCVLSTENCVLSTDSPSTDDPGEFTGTLDGKDNKAFQKLAARPDLFDKPLTYEAYLTALKNWTGKVKDEEAMCEWLLDKAIGMGGISAPGSWLRKNIGVYCDQKDEKGKKGGGGVSPRFKPEGGAE